MLYMSRADVARCWPRLDAICRDLRQLLRPYIPALTRGLGHGLALAEDPSGNTSYGTKICDLVAEGLVDAYRRHESGTNERVHRVAEALGKAGRSLTTPYLNPGSSEIELPEAASTERVPIPSTAHSSDDWSTAVDRLAGSIARQALWNGNRCTWLEPPVDPSAERVLEPAGAEVYHGLTGIGLLFAELYRKTGEPYHRRYAYGTVQQALDTCGSLPNLGLYAGAPGAGLAIALTTRALGDESLYTEGCRVSRERTEQSLSTPDISAFDLMYGAAGSVLAMIGLHRLGDRAALATAIRLGDKLISAAQAADSGLYWISGGQEESHGLVGLAHGAGGCSLALAELAEASGEQRFSTAADLARGYELSWFDEDLQNWPDVRDLSSNNGRNSTSARNRYAWCYGAPGLALARIRLAAVTQNKQAAAEAALALSRTRHVASEFPKFGHDVCICHGAAGLAEILSLAPEEFSEPDDLSTGRLLMGAALDAYQDDGPWSEGCGLMIGASGVALAALRAAEPDVISSLSLVPKEVGYAARSAAGAA